MNRLPLIVVLLLAAAPALAEERFLIALGNNRGAPSDVVLRWAESDAAAFAQTLGELGGISGDRRVVLLQGGVAQVRLAFATLSGRMAEARRRGERTVLFAYYSGHGDAQALRLGSERLELAELRDLLQHLPASMAVTIVDACHSGALVHGRSKGLAHASPFDVSYERDTGPDGRVTIASAGASELAQESDELRGSFFTHHFLTGLRGAADTDGGGEVTLDEAYRYVYSRTVRESYGAAGVVQHPITAAQVSGEGDLILTRLALSQVALTLERELAGDVLITHQRDGRIIAELSKPHDRPVRLALKPGKYRVQVRTTNEVLTGDVLAPWGGEMTLRREQLESMPLARARGRGEAPPPIWGFGVGGGIARSLVQKGGTGPSMSLRLGRALEEQGWLRTAVRLVRSHAQGDLWHFEQHEALLSVSIGMGLDVGALRMTAFAGPALAAVTQGLARHDATRLEPISEGAVRERAWSVGGGLAGELELALPVWASFVMTASVAGDLTLLRQGETTPLRPGYGLELGARWELSPAN